MRDGQLLEKQSIDKMCADHVPVLFPSLLEPHLYISSSSRHIPTVVIQGRYDVVCPVCPYHTWTLEALD